MMRYLKAWLFACLLASMLVGCGGGATSSKPQPAAQPSEADKEKLMKQYSGGKTAPELPKQPLSKPASP